MSLDARPARTSRYPFPIPYGWFQVCWPDELPVGGVRPMRYFGRDLVAWRDAAGQPHAHDAFCPHLGAHLGYGGSVEACEIVCPFHGWKFDAEGTNTDIPYSERVNKKARIRPYPVVERNGLVMVWYHPHDEPPRWEVPEVPEIGSPDFSPVVRRHYQVGAHWQELAENTVDSAHFRYVHGTAAVPEVEDYTADGHHARMLSSQKFPTPRGVVEGRIDVESFGPGFSMTWFRGIVDTLLLGCSVPVDDEHTEVRFNFTVRNLGDAATTSSVGDAFVAEIDKQMREDVPIWENKAHLVRPALADTDGPFMKFRRWASQFYAEPSGDEREVYAP